MYKVFFSVIVLALASGLSMPQDCQAAQVSKVTKSAGSGKSVKSLFQSSIGKYPFDVNMFRNQALKARLVKLIGQSRYNYMVKNFDVQTPVEFENWNYHTMACQAHNCGGVEFELSYNPEEDALAVRYRIDGSDRFFKEKRSVNAIWDY